MKLPSLLFAQPALRSPSTMGHRDLAGGAAAVATEAAAGTDGAAAGRITLSKRL